MSSNAPLWPSSVQRSGNSPGPSTATTQARPLRRAAFGTDPPEDAHEVLCQNTQERGGGLFPGRLWPLWSASLPLTVRAGTSSFGPSAGRKVTRSFSPETGARYRSDGACPVSMGPKTPHRQRQGGGPECISDFGLRAEVDETNGTSLRKARLSMSCGIAEKQAFLGSSTSTVYP